MTDRIEGWDRVWHWIEEDGEPVWWERIPPKPYGGIPYFEKVDIKTLFTVFGENGELAEVREVKAVIRD